MRENPVSEVCDQPKISNHYLTPGQGPAVREIYISAKTRSDRDFEMSLCYTPEAFSCSEETKYNINHCLELASSFPKMYNITMFLI